MENKKEQLYLETIALLEKQVTILKESLRLKEQQSIISTPQITYQPLVINECQHEYPQPWMATVPPTCRKCGKQAYGGTSFTVGYNPAHQGAGGTHGGVMGVVQTGRSGEGTLVQNVSTCFNS